MNNRLNKNSPTATSRRMERIAVLGLAMGAVLLASGGTASGAANERRGAGEDRHVEQGSQGWLMINGHRCAFEVRGSVERSLVHALRDLGYRARISNGCVVIDGRRVRFTASLPGYRFVLSRRGHRTLVRVESCERLPIVRRSGHWDRSGRGRSGRHWDRRDDHGPRYRRWHRSRRGCDLGFGFRIGDGRVSVRLPRH